MRLIFKFFLIPILFCIQTTLLSASPLFSDEEGFRFSPSSSSSMNENPTNFPPPGRAPDINDDEDQDSTSSSNDSQTRTNTSTREDEGLTTNFLRTGEEVVNDDKKYQSLHKETYCPDTNRLNQLFLEDQLIESNGAKIAAGVTTFATSFFASMATCGYLLSGIGDFIGLPVRGKYDNTFIVWIAFTTTLLYAQQFYNSIETFVYYLKPQKSTVQNFVVQEDFAQQEDRKQQEEQEEQEEQESEEILLLQKPTVQNFVVHEDFAQQQEPEESFLLQKPLAYNILSGLIFCGAMVDASITTFLMAEVELTGIDNKRLWDWAIILGTVSFYASNVDTIYSCCQEQLKKFFINLYDEQSTQDQKGIMRRFAKYFKRVVGSGADIIFNNRAYNTLMNQEKGENSIQFSALMLKVVSPKRGAIRFANPSETFVDDNQENQEIRDEREKLKVPLKYKVLKGAGRLLALVSLPARFLIEQNVIEQGLIGFFSSEPLVARYVSSTLAGFSTVLHAVGQYYIQETALKSYLNILSLKHLGSFKGLRKTAGLIAMVNAAILAMPITVSGIQLFSEQGYDYSPFIMFILLAPVYLLDFNFYNHFLNKSANAIIDSASRFTMPLVEKVDEWGKTLEDSPFKKVLGNITEYLREQQIMSFLIENAKRLGKFIYILAKEPTNNIFENLLFEEPEADPI